VKEGKSESRGGISPPPGGKERKSEG